MTERRKRSDLAAVFLLLALVIVFFWRFLLGGQSLIPADVLFSFPPWKSYASSMGVSYPHNELLSDMILQNYAWKGFARSVVAEGELPLWNPGIFSGMPFLAGGQSGTLYPLGFFFYLMPVAQAYGWFTALHFFLGGLFMFLFMRVLRVSPLGALLSAVAFMLSSIMVVSVTWPMVISTIIWLPLLLVMVELLIRREIEGRSTGSLSSLALVLMGGVVVGLQFLAGHLEYSIYVLFTTGFYVLGRVLFLVRRGSVARRIRRAFLGVGIMLVLGSGLAAAQLVPFLDLARDSYRSGSVSYEQVVGWALPKKQVLSIVMPDFFGNPSHHSYVDVIGGQSRPVTGAADPEGHPRSFPFWGSKNYVEAASYVGVLTLILAAVAVVSRNSPQGWIFLAYGAFSLLMAFGTPVYRLFWSLPGLNQLHTPFRWLFPYSISMAILAGLGFKAMEESGSRPAVVRIGSICVALGGLVAALLVLSRWLAADSIALADNLRRALPSLSWAFPSGQMLFSYEFRNLLVFALLLVAAGAAMVLRKRLSGARTGAVLLFILIADLFFFGYDYNGAADPQILDFTPPSIRFLKEDRDIFRIVSFGPEDTMPPNTSMLVGLQDVRGYDSIIPRQYVDFWRLIEEPQGLLYNRLHKLVSLDSLKSALLDLMNVKYVVTTQNLVLPGYTEAYRGEINIYRNDDYLPRSFVAFQALQVASQEESWQVLSRPSFNPRTAVAVEKAGSWPSLPIEYREPPLPRIVSYRPNAVEIRVTMPQAGFLVLTDSYFPGWHAYVNGAETEIYRADGIYRGVYLPPGEHTVLFKYSPDSFKTGLYMSFLSVLILLVGVGYGVWRQVDRGVEESNTVRRVARNTAFPMTTQLLNKVMDFAFAIFMLRMLGPMNAGKYAFAVVLIGYFMVFTDFGLGILLTREVARDRSQVNRYLGNTIVLRLILCLVSLPLLTAIIGLYSWRFSLAGDAAIAIFLLMVSLFPTAISAALSSVFIAYEKMEYPAAIAMMTNLFKVILGTAVLLLGWGIVGLASVSVLASLFTALVFYRLIVAVLASPALAVDLSFQKEMIKNSLPLMMNNFLSTMFFRVDVLLLQPMKGDIVNGWYTSAYRFIDGLNVIPSFFTLAIFPVLSRYATSARDSLVKAYLLSIKALLIVSVPIMVGTILLADRFVLLFFGEEYAPAIPALRILIWFLPFSFINSLTQYVLIAVNQQRFLTFAFVLGAVFNIAANLILIPIYSYLGASLTTVMSEIVLLVPFMYAVYRHVGAVSFWPLLWRPIVAAGAMGIAMWWGSSLPLPVLILAGMVVYALTLLLLRTFTEEERAMVRELRGLASR